MRSRSDEEGAVLAAAASALGGSERIVLAVSGGLDSMVLLDAAAKTLSNRSRFLVATFNHGTGLHASRAAKLVEKCAKALGFRCVVGASKRAGRRESEWREERWNFLHATARRFKGSVATAHTLDDQVETVFMRILRDAGPRGLAALFADSDVIRPFVTLTRSQLASYAYNREVRHVNDPSNESRAHLRNRVRHDILPAITRIRPAFTHDLLMIARMSAQWRQDMSETVAQLGVQLPGDGSVRVARAVLAGYDAASLRALWPAIAAEAGVVMDRRGTHRVAEFTMKGHTGGSIQLSGGIEVRMFRDHLLLKKWDAGRVEMIRSARLGHRIVRPGARPELT
ncbi:MAG TPA: tRNA lysidine(34) synthetase TilS [Gemmatimonadaceae bacterium]|nr:tRNA lysidine(34) synthetase TilS [Gemmatimonadaceae bacterium]